MEGLLSLAAKAALKAGGAIMEVYSQDDMGVENKADNSPVTVADLRADAVIASVLEISGLPLLSEEGRNIPFGERKAWDRFWLVDPLDGTKEFISRNGEFTVNIALVEGQTPVAGVIYAPVSDVLYAGIAGRGAWRLDAASGNPEDAGLEAAGESAEKKNVNCGDGAAGHHDPVGGHARDGAEFHGAALPEGAVTLPCIGKKGYGIVASRSFLDDRTGAFVDGFCRKFEGARIVTSGSSLKLCMLASGEADIYPRFSNISEWDTAAGHAIVVASGGFVVQALRTDMPLLYNKRDSLNPWFIACRSRELLEAVSDMIPKESAAGK